MSVLESDIVFQCTGGQSSDELLMISVVLCFAYCLVELKSLPNKLFYPWLPWCVILLFFIATAFYQHFQANYHVFLIGVRLMTYISLVSLIVSV
jgi:hypothetical protein